MLLTWIPFNIKNIAINYHNCCKSEAGSPLCSKVADADLLFEAIFRPIDFFNFDWSFSITCLY